ncbi:MAG: hypothetical protein CUR34_05915 [Sediminibacterium sp.]|nr:MAG: hypothetical protein CUR34_05915 [Sediminibacterium sp.] [Sediminibacterium sp. FEMGT703S]
MARRNSNSSINVQDLTSVNPRIKELIQSGLMKNQIKDILAKEIIGFSKNGKRDNKHAVNKFMSDLIEIIK